MMIKEEHREAMRQEIKHQINLELDNANQTFPQFHSGHEAYAVLLEEVEETITDLKGISYEMELMWLNVKNNDSFERNLSRILSDSIMLIEEAIQVGAMAQKGLDFCGGKK